MKRVDSHIASEAKDNAEAAQKKLLGQPRNLIPPLHFDTC